ncbi:porin [Corallococcus sp. CA053C]|nr:porin [Corallococcus sp. CA053C]RKG96908.1 porin [Corallococcus sp. CA053C]
MPAAPGPAVLVATGLLLAAAPARAQEQAAEGPPAAKPSVVVQVSDEGFSLASEDKAFVLKLRGLIQTDGRFFFDDPERTGTNTFVMRRVRPFLEGTLFGSVDFRLVPDFGNGQPLLQDAWVDLHPREQLRLRVGKFKTPFGLELLQSDADVPFIERGLTVDLVPNRDEGLELHGAVLAGRLLYSLAALNGDPDGTSTDLNTDDSFDLVARLFAHPFKGGGAPLLQGLGLGMAVTWGQQFGTATSPGVATQRSTGQQAIFNYLAGTGGAAPVLAYGEHVRYSPQGYFYGGPLGVLAEYVSSSQDLQVGDVRARLQHRAWQALISWVLFGGKASFEGVKPTAPFNLGTGTGGALEVAARYHSLQLDDDAFPLFADPARSVRAAKGFGIAVTEYFNKRVRFSVNFHRTNYEGGAPDGDRPAENALLTRLQLTF